MIKSLISKYNVPGDFNAYHAASNKAQEDEGETSPKDYTFDERLEHKAAASLPTMPQLLPQLSQLQYSTGDLGLQTHSLEAPLSSSLDEFSGDPAQQDYIPTDVDMAVFDVPDMSMTMFDINMSWNPTL